MTPPAEIAAALRRHAQGLYHLEAAAELLIAHQSWLRRTDFTAQFVRIRNEPLHSHAMATIDWTETVTALQTGQLPCSASEHKILQIAASLAAGAPVDLQEALTGLDNTNLDLVAATVLHAGGRRPHK